MKQEQEPSGNMKYGKYNECDRHIQVKTRRLECHPRALSKRKQERVRGDGQTQGNGRVEVLTSE